ncbi:protein YLS9-like [Canna indica]|uniref:Protein YLS9-like n=1 Tax=Canna indica TaxID=4628 RepID=A0AAQ3JRB7_9LILI|nr:protein YLS9-like [Canna indica]
MAELHRIHPVDVEAPVPSPSRAPYERIGKADEELPPSAAPHPVPVPRPKKQRSRCCKCLCWTLLSFVILIVLIGATVGILFLVFHPKIPKYSVDRLGIANFTIDDNMTVAATFNLTVTMRNPNKKIGIYYRGGSHLSASYNGTELCSGTFPVFYQGHRNTTVVNLLLSGDTQLGGGLLQELQEQQQTGTIPLVFRGKVPVRVKLGSLKLPRITFKVRCDIVVNSLSANNNISLRSSRCKFRLKL